jgi:predicted anti-sigma-YlaC factor YlaD
MSPATTPRHDPGDRVESGRQSVPPTHLPDELRLGVLAGIEDQELRLAAHLLDCELCREPGLELADFADTPDGRCAPQEPVTCWEARNALLRFFEQGRELEPNAVNHLNICECCRDHFLEPARAVRALEDESSVAAQD